MQFEFATAARIIFGSNSLDKVAPIARQWASNVFLITGSSIERASRLIANLKKNNLKVTVYAVESEPTTQIIIQGTELAHKKKSEMVIAMGGGSAIDTGKAIAALVPNQGDLFDYLEVIGQGKPLTIPSLPYIAIPTTAGTGTEVTRNAVITSPAHKVKVSLRSPFMLPSLAVIDPVLTYSLPPLITATTGLDTFTQVLEPFVSNKANPLTDVFSREGLKLASRSLENAYRHGDNEEARSDMCMASLLGGLALANSKLGAVHGFAGPLGGMMMAPHGAICATLLPHVIEVNVHTLKEREPQSPFLTRFAEISQIITTNSKASAQDGVEWIKNLCRTLQTPSLSAMGLKKQDFPQAVAKAKQASSMKGNPIILTDEELLEILNRAF